MTKVIVQALIIIALPTFVFVGGGWLMSEISGRALPANQTPLGQRFGYDADDARSHWSAFNDKALRAEQRFLELDLVYPFLYGSALAFSLFIAWTSLGRPFNSLWLVTPSLIMVCADWTENVAQLHEMKRFINDRATTLNPNWIRIASIATTLKWVFVAGVSLFLISLVVVMICRSLRS